jgi:alpha/beta superfamily hydrolase
MTPRTIEYAERPLLFAADGSELFGIVTVPADRPAVLGAVLLPGGGLPLHTNRNRFAVRLARDLVSAGYATLRMDYHGTGESSGDVERFHLGHPFVGDASAGIDALRSTGVDRVVLIGLTCFGSRTALATSAARDDVVGVVAMATPLRDFAMGERRSSRSAPTRPVRQHLAAAVSRRTLRQLSDPRARAAYTRAASDAVRSAVSRFGRRAAGAADSGVLASPKLVRDLSSNVARGVGLCLVYGDDDEYFHEFRDARARGELRMLDGKAAVELIPGRVHGLTHVAVQDAVQSIVVRQAEAWAGLHD